MRRPVDSAGNTALAFTRAGPDFAVEPGIAGQRIGYRLTRRRRSRSSTGRSSTTSTTRRAAAYPLVGGVRGFRVRMLGIGNAWLPRWPMTGDTGCRARCDVELELDDGTTIERVIVLR